MTYYIVYAHRSILVSVIGFSFNDVLTINPPGIKMDGNVGENSVEWTSKYGSVVSSIIPFFAGYGDAGKEYGLGIKEGEPCFGLDFEKDGGADGINTEGLGAHLLELGEAHGTSWCIYKVSIYIPTCIFSNETHYIFNQEQNMRNRQKQRRSILRTFVGKLTMYTDSKHIILNLT